MEEEKKHERSFELRSEKVRSIIGEIPSSLVRYGIASIGVVILCLFVVAYFVPYKQVYLGDAVIGKQRVITRDSTDIAVLLKFENKRLINAKGQEIFLHSPKGTVTGYVQNLSNIRDTLDFQKSICRFKSSDIRYIDNQTIDFHIVCSSSNILHKMLGNFGL